ncbi:MAG TPA: lipopolysaccharide assembly protein LapA domain-containing protein [Gemmatimonadota bacterium]|nr:lipopolysaccharide assembly protein LapA domain-containing protein [Gemmatimonadota bacterium]
MRPARIVAIAGAFVAVALLVLFALVNRGQPIALDFGFWSWQGDAIYAIYAGACVGLIAMFAVSLPSDLAIRREHRRLLRREHTSVERASDPGAPDRA